MLEAGSKPVPIRLPDHGITIGLGPSLEKARIGLQAQISGVEEAAAATLETQIEESSEETSIAATLVKGGLGKSLLPVKRAHKLYPLIRWAKEVLWGTGKRKPEKPKAPTSYKLPEVEKDAPKPATEKNGMRQPGLTGKHLYGSKKTTGHNPSKNSTKDGFRIFVDDKTCGEIIDKARKLSGMMTGKLLEFYNKLKDRIKVIVALIKMLWNWKNAIKPDFVSLGGKVMLGFFALFVIWKAYSRRHYIISPPSLVDVLGINANPNVVHRNCRY